jgi:predicted MFS family arabinose efflux permease
VRARELIAPLRERPFRLMFGAQATSVLGDWIAPLAIAFAVLELGGSPADLGLALAARTLPLVVFSLAGGVWADRLPRHRLMLAADAGRFLSQALLAGLLLSGSAEVWHVIALQAVGGSATAFFRPAATGLTPATVRPEHLQQANALLSLTIASAQVVGPAIAGVLVATSGAGWAVAADAATFAVSGLLLSRIALPPRAAPAARRTFWDELREGWAAVRERTWLWVSIVLFAVAQLLVLAPFFVLGPVVAHEELGGAAAWALIASAEGAGALIGALIALRVRPRRPLVASNLSLLLVIPPMVLLGAGSPAVAVAAATVGMGVALALSVVLWETTLQEHVPEALLSRVSAYDWMGSTALRPLGYAIVGPVAAAVGVGATLEVAAALTAVCLLASLAVPDIRGLTRGFAPRSAAGRSA